MTVARLRRDMMANARDICRQVLSRDPPPDLPDDDTRAEIAAIVAAADRRAAG